MNGKLLRLLVLLALALALGAQSLRLRDRLGAAVLLARSEAVSLEAVRMGKAGSGLLREVLGALKLAGERDPREVGIPIATGSVHLLLGSPQAAVDYYQKALELEVRPEIYLNLGRAQEAMGQSDQARMSYHLALRLNPLLRLEVPEPMRPAPDPP